MKIILVIIAIVVVGYFINNTFSTKKVKTSYYEGPTIYKDVALRFANHLVEGQFVDAHSLLSSRLQLKYSPQILADKYMHMIEYFYTKNITVNEEFVIREGDRGDKQDIYVPIEEPGNSEAVAVIVDYDKDILSITEIDYDANETTHFKLFITPCFIIGNTSSERWRQSKGGKWRGRPNNHEVYDQTPYDRRRVL